MTTKTQNSEKHGSNFRTHLLAVEDEVLQLVVPLMAVYSDVVHISFPSLVKI